MRYGIFISLLVCRCAAAAVPTIPDLFRAIGQDQKQIISSPFRLDQRDALVWGPTAASMLYLMPHWNGRRSADQRVESSIDRDEPPMRSFLKGVTRVGTGEVLFGASGVSYLWARWREQDNLGESSAHMIEALVDATIWTTVGKAAFGRRRPMPGAQGGNFHGPGGYFKSKSFKGFASFPSGHTTLVFTAATVISGEKPTPWVQVPVYAVALGVGYSRIYLEEHWLSDIVMGAALGHSIGLLVERHGGQDPNRWVRFYPYTEDNSAGLGMTVTF